MYVTMMLFLGEFCSINAAHSRINFSCYDVLFSLRNIKPFFLFFLIPCSAQTEEFVIPTSDCISPCVEELKQIPKCAHLVIGHNGYGEFGLW